MKLFFGGEVQLSVVLCVSVLYLFPLFLGDVRLAGGVNSRGGECKGGERNDADCTGGENNG